MPKRELQDWLKSYMQYTAYSESPEALHFWSGVSALAGALRRKIIFDQGYYQWTPNFYIIFVAPPGIVSKSTSMAIGMSLLKEVPDIQFGPNAITWQALVSSLAGSTFAVEMPDKNLHSMSCLTFASSELGTLLEPRDRGMVDLLVDLWDGNPGAWKKATKGSGNDTIVNPWLNIIACTTPLWIAENMPKGVVGGGFTSRCIFVFAKGKRKLVAYPKMHIPPGHMELKKKLINDLAIISELKGWYEVSKEACEWGTEWYKGHNSQSTSLNMDQFGGYLSRKQCHAHKLAMIISASYKDETVITKYDLQTAVAILDGLEADLPQVFRSLETSSGQETTQQMLSYIQQKGRIERQDLYRAFIHIMPYREFESAIQAGVNAGYITPEVGRDGMMYLKWTVRAA